MTNDTSEVSVVGHVYVSPCVFAELGNELIRGRGAASGTVFDHHFSATFGCNMMLCVLMWDALVVPAGLFRFICFGIDVPESVQLGDGSVKSVEG